MGRTIHITVHSAQGLINADADEGGQSDPFVVICFDANVHKEIARTETASDTSSPEWDQSFEIDITKHIETVIEETGEEPEKLTFCVYDGDVSEAQPLGMASLDFSDLVKAGKYEGALPVEEGGEGSISVTVEMKKVKLASMLKDNAAVTIAGGVVGVAALGALSAYLYKRYEKKKAKLEEQEDVDIARTGIAYGADVDDDDDDEEERGNFKKWWEMDDEGDDDEEENRWGEVDVEA